MEELSASDEERMLASIQGARDSAEYEPVNIISPRKEHPVPQKKLSWPLPHNEGVGVKQNHDDSPTVTSDDDTSLSTWKPPVSVMSSTLWGEKSVVGDFDNF